MRAMIIAVMATILTVAKEGATILDMVVLFKLKYDEYGTRGIAETTTQSIRKMHKETDA